MLSVLTRCLFSDYLSGAAIVVHDEEAGHVIRFVVFLDATIDQLPALGVRLRHDAAAG